MQVNLGLIVGVSIVVIVIAYALGVYFRRRADNQPLMPPPKPSSPAAKRVSPAAAPVRRPDVTDREQRVVINWLLSQAFEQTGIRVADDKLAYDRIVAVARLAIDTLKTEPSYDISLPFLTADASGPKHLEARLTRDMFADLVKY